ncbi:hypothetical protein ACFL34_05485 [Candidatus Sumerlaeota bacterium]
MNICEALIAIDPRRAEILEAIEAILIKQPRYPDWAIEQLAILKKSRRDPEA